MMALSSFKPFSDSVEIGRNQRMALESWLGVFDFVVYLGSPEPQLSCSRTVFVPCSRLAPIRLLMLLAGLADCVACVINADIVLAPHARLVFDSTFVRAEVATSFRLEFDPMKPLRSQRPVRVDNGLDIFIARPRVWRRLWKVVPGQFMLGKPVWDSWCWAWFQANYGAKFVDLSHAQCVFHPRHSRG